MLGKSELVQQLAQKTGLTSGKANQYMNAFLDTVTEALSRGEEVRITGFGSFRVTETKERMAISPRTRQPIRVPARKRVGFSPGAQLTAAVRGEAGRKAA